MSGSLSYAHIGATPEEGFATQQQIDDARAAADQDAATLLGGLLLALGQGTGAELRRPLGSPSSEGG